MTFKHVKFEDSVVMRSLERLAKEKGLVKEEPITKSASNKLAPSTNLTENVLNLCAGLRERGFHKAASDLESKFMTLKHAQTLYETSKEKGEDLIDAAHPKGSHKIEDIEGDDLAVVETILDQQLKSIKMVEKNPTGKLASGMDILKAVKTVLGEDFATLINQKLNEAKNHANQILQIMSSTASPEEKGATGMGRTMIMAPVYRALTPANVAKAAQAIQAAQNELQFMDPKKREQGKMYYNISDYGAWTQILEHFNAMKSLVAEAQKYNQGDSGLYTKMAGLRKKLDTDYRALLEDEGFTPQDRHEGNAEINGIIKSLDGLMNIFAKLSPEEKEAQTARFEGRFNQIKASADQLYKEIMGQA